MCDEAGPGMCFAGQAGAGSLFGFMFGGVTKGFFGSDKVWWSAVPGVAVGVCMGTMAAQQPDGPPSAAHFWVVTNTAVASTMNSELPKTWNSTWFKWKRDARAPS